ncbi:centromere-associated protein E isoform X3 [Trachinotus anak]|uniref:centromere-associated protein E isoform X3 n=1 Tax=Trachinotus anak TaxID=443729 RepID=UPI0039F184E5
MTEESAVKVCVRVRPPSVAREESAASENAEPLQLFWKADKKSIHQIDDGNSTKSFSFDRVFTAEETTNQLYQDIAKPLVVSTVEGYNGTIFAYGQTSSGKTFTMMGSDHIPGVIPLAVEDVFQTIKNCPKKEFLLRVSYMEIYNETVTDLLVDSWKRKPLEVRETINKNIFVADLTEELVTSPAQALAWIRKGEKNRHYGKTKMNQRSSRSHTIFRMILESRERSDPASGENADGAIIVSNLNLVDLAGSERASQTGAEGTRFKEGCNINRSLFTLGQVIKKLTDESQKGFTNYRDSKLTRILQNSLGGNAKTVIICTITPVALDETLSTLQFASTAKKMKNDPHVTEVSDDGALLKRYRNEIVDLKRRLQEVSSITHTTVTEKKVLSQLLQEKDQLQREQEDRIRNLTKLIVTSSNLVPVKKMPKRRVTWGGKMLRLAHPSGCDSGPSDLSFAESFTRKRKADRSCLMELGEDDEDFDSHWEIPDEPLDETEMSESSVTVRSFGDSPKDFASPDQMCELLGKVSDLELKLEMESQLKEEAMTKLETLDGRVADLQLQLQTETQQKQEALEKMQAAEQRAAELELQQQTEAQQKLEATEKVEMLQLRVADLERQLEDQSHARTEPDEQMRREFAETIQLCETLASEKDTVAAERDYLKQELGMFIEQTEILEKEKAALSQELEEKRELDEFKSLEEECRTEQENQLRNEICSLKKIYESSELRCQELQNMVETLSEQLKRKTEFAEELQSMSSKDLVQEVAKLRRSLDDAEGVSRDTKKEWAVLRSQNIALEGMNVTLTVNHDKMEAEVNSLRFQLETEKSCYKKMQSDLQRELNVVFDENTKLTALLDGKVPKNLIDSVELERTVASLNKELIACHDAEGALREQLEELVSLPNRVDNLMKQVCELSEELCTVQTERDSLLSARAQCQDEAQQLRGSLQTSQDQVLKIQADLSAANQREADLRQQCADVTQQLNSLHSNLERLDSERSQLMANYEERGLKLSQLGEELQELRAKREALLSGAQTSAEETEQLLSAVTCVTAERDQLRLDLQQHKEMMQSLSQELECVRGEKESLLKANAQSSAEEMEKLLSTVASLSAVRDQLKIDLQENVEMMIENQEELRTALDKNREQKEQIRRLEAAQTSTQDQTVTEMRAQLEEKQIHFDHFPPQVERLQAALQAVSEQKSQLESELQYKLEMATAAQSLQQSPQEQNQRNLDLERLSEERQAQLEQEVAETQCLLHSLQEELQEQKLKNSDLVKLCELKESDSQQQTKTLSEELERAQAERHGLLLEKEKSCQSCTEEMEKLLCRATSLSEERDQLQETLEGLRQEKQKLRAELEDKRAALQTEITQLNTSLQTVTEQKKQLEDDLQKMASTSQKLLSVQEELCEQKQVNSDLQKLSQEKECSLHQQIKTLTEKLEKTEAERDSLLSERTANSHSCTEEMEKLLCRATSLSEERDQLQETLEGLRQEKQQLRAELEDKREMIQCELQQQLSSEPLSLKEEQEAQQLLQIQQLENHLEKTKEEVSQLKSDLQENVDLMIENQEELRESQEKIRVLQEEISVLQSQKAELESRPCSGGVEESAPQIQELQNQIQSVTEECERMRAERDSLLSEKTANSQSCTEEMEKLLCRATSLSEERDQLQETLEGLRQEKQKLRAELEDRREMTVTEQKKQLEDDLQKMASTSQKLLSVQEELCEQKQVNSDLQKLSQEKECSLHQQIKTLTETLEKTEAERDSLLSERTANSHSCTEEMDKLLCRATSLSKERDQLQETLEGLRQEKQQLRAELEDKREMISAIQERLSEQEQLNVQQQSERGEQEARLQQEVQQLEEQLRMNKERHTQTRAEADTLQQLLAEANTIISALREQLSSLDQGPTTVKETLSSRLHHSAGQLQDSFRGFQHFIDTCSRYSSTPMDKALRVQCSLKPHHLTSLPKATMTSYTAVCQLGLQTVQSLGNIVVHLRGQAQGYRNLFEELVKKDLAVFEERRLQDVLLCRVQAPSYSVRDEDLNTLWEHRLAELLDKRQLYQQKMASTLEKLWANMASYPSELSAEIRERERFQEQLQAMFTIQPISFSGLDSILSRELDRRSAVVHSKKTTLQGIIAEQTSLFEELKLLEAQAYTQLTEERSKSLTLLQALEGAPLKTELSLLNDNQQLVLQHQQMEEKVKALRLQNEQLEEAQINANHRVSNHKQATQLLQTELQDSRAQVEEKENTIQTLRSKLRESEKNASPSAAQLEQLRTKLFKVEVELSSAFDKHQQEIQMMTTVLNEKEDSLRKLKETLRRSQQQGEESFLQGEDLHAKLTNPRGLVIKSSILLEKTKLEEEVKQLQVKITELEGLVSTQQAEISKWKSRAVKLKAKSKPEVDKLSSPCTPTKRGFPITSDSSNFLSSPKKVLVTPKKIMDSPRRLLDSPKVSLLDSPKSRFFDVGGSSEVLSRTCPKQFFDNSSLGTIPEVFRVPEAPAPEEDAGAAVGAARQEEWWPLSPKQEDMCKTQ